MTPQNASGEGGGELLALAEDLIDRGNLKRKLDALIDAAARQWGTGSTEHNLVRDISDAVCRMPSAIPLNAKEIAG